jgi:hypothetical protein
MALSKKMRESDITWEAIGRVAQKPDSNISAFIGEYVLYHFYHYEEPTRTGTPKGEKIGFSWKKNHAAMLVGITNWKQKDIAKDCEVSHGLLRKWRTDPDFYKASFYHAVEFVHEIIKRVKKTLADGSEEIEKYCKKGGQNPFESDPKAPLDDYERILVDAPFFSDTVSFLIFKYMATLGKELESKTEDEFDERIKKVNLFTLLHTILRYGADRKLPSRPPHLAKLCVYIIRDHLESKRVLSEREQREMLLNLSHIERTIDDYRDEFERSLYKKLPGGKETQKMEEYWSKVAKNDEIYELLNNE